MTKLEFVALRDPLFHAGKNFGQKIESKKPGDAELIYYEDSQMLHITHNGKTSWVHVTSTSSMTPALVQEVAAEPANTVQTAKTGKHQKVQSAQVHTPTSHVFGEGPGHS